MTPLRDLHDLDTALLAAQSAPILIFKHSPTCGISAQAHAELADLVHAGRLPIDIYLVSVRQSREVALDISRRFAIRHESPQVLLVQGERVLWHGSHFHVNGDEVLAAIARAGAGVAR